MFQLMIYKEKANYQVSLPADVAVFIGRGKSCNVKLDDPAASRVHCRVISHDGRVTLYDAGSRWGTFVNGKRVSECNLMVGDCILVGESILRLTVDSTETALRFP